MKNLSFSIFLIFLFLQIFYAQDAISSNQTLQIGHNENVNTVLWSPDNTKVLSHSSPDNSLRLWDVKTGQQLWVVNTSFVQRKLETYTLNDFDWSPDQKLIASTGYNGKLQLWDANSGKLIWIVDAHTDEGEVVKFSPDGEFLVSIAQPKDTEGEIKLWDVKTGKLVRKFIGKAEEIISANFDKSGEILITGSFEGEVSVWNVKNGSQISSKKFNPCGLLKKNARGFGYSPDLSLFAGRCWEKTVITNTKTGKVIRILDMRGDYEKEVGFSRDGKILALTDVGQYKILNLPTNKISKIENIVNSGFTYELNNDGSLMAEGGGYKAEGIQITDVTTGKALNRLESHPGVINSLAFNSDGSHFISGSSDRILRVWNTNTKEIIFSLSGHTDEILLVEFSSNGQTITSKSRNETIVWDATNGKKISEEKTGIENSEEIKEKVISQNGNYILEDLGDEKPFRLIDAKNGSLVKEFSGLTQIQGFKFTPDNKQFISAAYFQPLLLWDIEDGSKVRDFDIGYSHSNVISFSPDGKTFITGGWNQNILMYELESGKLIWSLFPIDQEEMRAHKEQEARRIRYLQDKTDYENQADLKTANFTDKIYITFEHYGDMTNPGDLRMIELDTPNKSKVKKSIVEANAIWLRLHNDSPLPIEIPTQSMYLPNQKCFHEFPNGKKLFGLCDNREISVWHGLEDKDGKSLSYGFDFGSSTILLPKTSVLFAIPREILKDGNAIDFNFKFQNEIEENKIGDYGTDKKLIFKESDLPKN